MGKDRRPFQDETLIAPILRNYYGRTNIGRPGDPREEPIKFTQSINEKTHYEAQQEWIARVPEQGWVSDRAIKGELEEEIAIMDKMDRLLRGDLTALADTALAEKLLVAATGESTVEDALKTFGVETEGKPIIDSVEEFAMSLTTEEVMELAGQATSMLAPDAEVSGDDLMVFINELINKNMVTCYGMYPPIIPIPLRMSPAVNTILYGPTTDVCFPYMDVYTNEALWIVIWHVEKGLQTSLTFDGVDGIYNNLLERRHMRTGEKFKYLGCNRPMIEGSTMFVDVLKDLRNERTPEYAMDPIYFHGATTGAITCDVQIGSRSLFELIPYLNVYNNLRIGYPFQTYVSFAPVPGLYDLLMQLPIDMLGPRFISIFAGAEIWMGGYTVSHLETRNEIFGQEMIPPTYTESLGAYIRYGMDIMRYPPTFLRSKHLYGQDAQVRVPTEYPVPEKIVTSISDAAQQIERARKEHPEWLTGYSGI